MQEIKIAVTHEVGLHARPAAAFVKAAKSFESTISLRNLTRDTDFVDAKSLVQVFKIAVAQDHEIELTIEGPDEEAAATELVRLIETNFGE